MPNVYHGPTTRSLDPGSARLVQLTQGLVRVLEIEVSPDVREGRADHYAPGARQRDERGDPAQVQGAHHTGVTQDPRGAARATKARAVGDLAGRWGGDRLRPGRGLLEAVAALYARVGVQNGGPTPAQPASASAVIR